ncbi:unnamed protein product [Dicrocoelium dendriticum]|nr:unnamed protein product [Dicrocoelium dendriticum]
MGASLQVTNLAQQDKLMRKFPLECRLNGPERIQSSGCFRAQFQGHTALDQRKVIDELQRTKATEEVTYDIDPFQYRFLHYPKKQHGTSTKNDKHKRFPSVLCMSMVYWKPETWTS